MTVKRTKVRKKSSYEAYDDLGVKHYHYHYKLSDGGLVKEVC